LATLCAESPLYGAEIENAGHLNGQAPRPLGPSTGSPALRDRSRQP
jgi:hypothetical protein